MFEMDLGSREYGGHVVVSPRGELDLLYAPTVATALAALASRQPRIIVNLAGLEFIDVSGVAALAHGRRHARSAGGTCCWPRPGDRYGGFSRSSGRLTASPFKPAWPRRPPAREPPGR